MRSRVRSSRPVEAIATRFIDHARSEDPPLARALEGLDPQGLHELAGILGRFDAKGHAELDPEQRLLASRILRRLRTIDTAALTLANKVLDYLDLNVDGRLSSNEFELCVQVLEIFAHAESPDDLLSVRELQMLYAVLRHFDADDSARLESKEVRWLRQALSDPQPFMARMRRENPHLARVLDS